jgi:hypothetical protein
MPVENLEEEGLPKNPNLELAQLKFHLELPQHKSDDAAKAKLMEAIKTDSKFRHRLVSTFSSSLCLFCCFQLFFCCALFCTSLSPYSANNRN